MHSERLKNYWPYAAAVVAGLGIVGAAKTIKYGLEPSQVYPKMAECTPHNTDMRQPAPPFPSPEDMARVLDVPKKRILLGFGGRVVCNNVVNLGNITDNIVVHVSQVQEDCVATLQYPPTKEYPGTNGTNVYDVFCPAPQIAAQPRHQLTV